MTREEFETSLRRFVAGLTDTDAARITRSTLLFEGLIDSMRVLDLIAFIEQSLSIRVPDEKIRLENFRNIRAIADAFWQEAAVEADA